MTKQNTIVSQEQMSVSELREWLANFGEQRRNHYEKGRIKEVTSHGKIRQNIQQIEVSLCSSSSSSSTTSAPAKDSQSVESGGGDHRSSKRSPSPVFRQFGEQSVGQEKRQIKSETDGGPDDYRIVSIRRLLDPPPSDNAETGAGLEDVLDQWPECASIWHRADDVHPIVLDEVRTVHSVELETPATPSDEESIGADDLLPCDTSSFSDPGVPSVNIEAFTALQLRNEGHEHDRATKKRGFRSKLPLLLCKSVNENDQNNTDEPVSDAPSKEEEKLENLEEAALQAVQSTQRKLSMLCRQQPIPKITSFPSHAVHVESFPKYVEPHVVVHSQEDSTVSSTWSSVEEYRFQDATMGDIFAEEMYRQDYRDCKKPALVSATVEKFGGSAKKSSVQRRREDLERKWAEDRPLTHEKKFRWHGSNGKYKRKVTLKSHRK